MNALKIGLFMSMAVALFSCGNEDNDTDSVAVVENAVRSGTWRVTLFEDSGNNETSLFSGYNFVFDASGTLTATNGSSIFIGSWSITEGKSDDDSPDDMHFNINFTLNNSFEDLSEDWHFISHSTTIIELIHVSGGNGGTDYLTFERN